MSTQINLITEKKRQARKAIRFITLFSLVVFTLFFIAAASLLATVLSLKNNLSLYTQNEQDLRAKLTSFSQTRERTILIQDRLVNIDKIIKTRKNLSTKIQSIMSIFPSNFLIDSVEGTENVVTFRLTTSDLSAVDNLLEEKLKNVKINNLAKVDFKSFEENKGGYSFNLDFRFIK